MKSYFTIFFTLVKTISILFTAIATVYFSMNFDFTKAIKLGILAGVMIGVSFSLLMAILILVVRIINQYKRNKTTFVSKSEEIKAPVTLNPTLYEKKHKSTQANLPHDNTPSKGIIEEKFMLLMDKAMAFEVSLNSINHTKIGDIIQQNKNEGFILLQSKNEEIKINISTLTRHTAQVLISSSLDNNNIKDIIAMLKEKEHSFMQY
jgi:hypothetical protein